MEHIKTQVEDHILSIFLDRGKSNAIDTLLLKELIETLEINRENDAVHGAILIGKENFFSAGLDLITLFGYNEDQIREFWNLFLEATSLLASFPKPIAAAISGHSPAGGCVFALCCDYRIMAEGNFVIGLNEIPVGLIVPESIFQLYAFWIGKRTAYQNLLEGKLLTPDEAKAQGLVDDVVPANMLFNTAAKKIKQISQFNQKTWQTSKLNFRKEIILKLRENREETIQEILVQWWLPSTRSILKSIIDNLTSKK
ncbi:MULTISPECIES: enoyl-CoA hydratase/isomerase family protein [Sphingobacterium]|uniref:Enoyl-CoA hydratase/isomerase family protein n=1 Tax=Sphingobacterium athyrii TaxID=2152717 RepID=A0A363NQM6_9SPHI|nr:MULTISPECIES: enoyl-CoA hydratase/isomerase family protein [Sphingobacterium]PUV23030.1 enoyl-CoA hydratase/isomerase family protein [Sphingobacterium athyrii]QIH31444.1 enoyl-CoA hydratase/isomerase family protein [Sphingobacterium sp. DR205]